MIRLRPCAIFTADDTFPAAPCIVIWASELPHGNAAAALLNLGENKTSTTVRLAELVGSSSRRYAVKEVWSGTEIGVFAADSGDFTATLRPHASLLYLLREQPAAAPLASPMAPAALPADAPVFLDVFLTDDCSDTPNASVELTAAKAAYPHCTHCTQAHALVLRACCCLS